MFGQDCWNARDEDAIAGARRALHSGRKVSMQGPRRCVSPRLSVRPHAAHVLMMLSLVGADNLGMTPLAG